MGTLCLVTGVSGSGKSTLVNEIFTKAVQQSIGKMKRVKPGKFDKIKGTENIDYVFRKSIRQLELAGITQPIIGIKRRSNVI